MISLALLASTPLLAGSLGSGSSDGLDEAFAQRRVAVLIGVDDYADPDLTGLKFAAKDANDLAGVLEDPEYGAFDRVFVLTGAEATSAEGIQQAIDFATADLQRDDTFLLYLSGHGTLTLDPVDGSRLWFLPSDGQLTQARETGIAISWLEERVAQVEARRRVLVMDTCHNGRDKSSLDPKTVRLLDGMRGDAPAPRGFREVSESEARLFAAQYHQPAMEDPDLGNGVYTHFLLEGLTDGAHDADLDGDGLIDVAEAHDYARDRTITHTGGLQVPRAEYRIVGREEIYLSGNASTRSRAERSLLAATDSVLASARVLIDGVPRGVLPEVVAVDPGLHRVELQDEAGRTLSRRTVHLRAGETTMAEDLLKVREPAMVVSVGGVVRHGAGAGLFTATSPELELTWLDALPTPSVLTTNAHLRLSAARGSAVDVDPTAQVTGGTLSAGLAAQWRVPWIPLVVGPELDLGFPWRSFEDSAGLHRQATLTLIPGLRTDLRIPVGRRSAVTLRYDARLVPISYDSAWTTVIEHGVSLGIGRTSP
jgi:uncharacterized caspase-like protein